MILKENYKKLKLSILILDCQIEKFKYINTILSDNIYEYRDLNYSGFRIDIGFNDDESMARFVNICEFIDYNVTLYKSVIFKNIFGFSNTKNVKLNQDEIKSQSRLIWSVIKRNSPVGTIGNELNPNTSVDSNLNIIENCYKEIFNHGK